MEKKLKEWQKIVSEKMKAELEIHNPMRMPKLKKIVVNAGLKEAVSNSKAITLAMNLLGKVACQLPVKTIAKKSIAGFKLREGMPIGTFVTLRGKRMYAFLYKLINIVLPKIRDFQGIGIKFDGRGNYNLGISSLEVFPEGEESGIAEFTTGVCITIVTNAENDKEAMTCLKAHGMPFKKNQIEKLIK
jgi:large subunit ribosomal protein L5